MGCDCLIEAAATMTACECESPGFCQRHACRKNGHLHDLCRKDPRYFAMWEAGTFPCPEKAEVQRSRFGFGDLVALLIRWVTFGYMKQSASCGCAKRKEWLNRITIWGWWRT